MAVGDHGQAFLTTHSPAILEALAIGEVSRFSVGADPVVLDGEHIGRVQKQSPDCLLSRLPVLGEGDTEVGFLGPFLNYYAALDNLPDIDALGIRLAPRQGQPQVLSEAQQFLQAGIPCGLFVDNEAAHAGQRTALSGRGGCAFGTWEGVRNIEEAVANWLPWSELTRLIELGVELRQRPAESLLQQVGQCVGRPGTATLNELRDQFDEASVRKALADAMQASGNAWFKTLGGGRALGQLILEIGLPQEIDRILLAFWRRVLQEAGWA